MDLHALGGIRQGEQPPGAFGADRVAAKIHVNQVRRWYVVEEIWPR
jgi:hypothetical protein